MIDAARKEQIKEAAKREARKYADEFIRSLKDLRKTAMAPIRADRFTRKIKTRQIPLDEAANIILAKRREIEKRREKAKERRR